MPGRSKITDPDDERLADYRALTDVELRTRWEPPNGLFIAEGELVLRRALAAGYRVRSVLVDEKRVDQLGDLSGTDAPVYAAGPDVLARTTGFHVHRGYSVHSGEPSSVFLAGMFQTVPGVETPADLDSLDDSNLGYLACMPIVAVDGPTVVELVDRIERTCAEYGLIPAIAVNPTGMDYLETVVNLYFDRTDQHQAETAHACNGELHRRLYSDGFRFYRADIENMRHLTERDTAPWGAIGLIKQALDPDRVIAPGGYCPS